MKKSVCIDCVPGKTPTEKFALARKHRFEGVEVNTLPDAASRQEYLALSRSSGVGISSVMNNDHWKYPLSDSDRKVRDKSLAGIAASIETAVALGTDMVLIVPAVVTADTTYEQALLRSRETISEILPLCQKNKVMLGIENVWNKFLLSPVEFAHYVDSFDSEFIAAYFDVGNIVAYGFPDHWIRTLGKRIKRLHVKGFDSNKHAFVQLRYGTIDWQRVVAALKVTGYTSFMTAELGPEGSDPLKGFRKISRDMDAILSM